MTDPSITRVLSRLSAGDKAAAEELYSLVYGRLRELARGFMREEKAGHVLQTTALVNEACLRLLGLRDVPWEDRRHFFRVAARAMRRVLIDHARKRNSGKRGAGAQVVPLDDVLDQGRTLFAYPTLDFIALDIALEKLLLTERRKGRVVELLYFGGLTPDQISEVLDVNRRTVDRDWSFARLWLIREMETVHPGPASN